MKNEVNFYLDKRKDKEGNLIDKDLMILLFYSFEGKRLQFYTGQRIDLSKWDNVLQRVKRNNVNSRGITASEINGVLSDVEVKVKKIYAECKALDFDPSVNYMRENLKELLIKEKKKTPPRDKEPFLKQFDSFIETTAKTSSHAYIKQLKSCKKHLEKYAKKKNISLTYSGINKSFFEKYRDYFNDELGNTNNSFAGQIRRIKSFMKWATEKRTSGKNYEYVNFKAPEKYFGKVIYLKWDEFIQLYNAKIENEHLQTVRDMFIFQSMVGMRFGDMYNLKKEHISKGFIKHYQEKTDEFVNIPINDYAREVLEKYKNYSSDLPLPRMENQVYNRSLKILFQEAKLNRPVEVVTKKGNEVIKEFKALHELASSHMARRNFIGLSIEKGVRSEIIMSISGHSKNSKSFSRYYEVADKQKAQAMRAFRRK
jgi:integrase